MEVILLEKIYNLGDVGDIVVVRDGFARNCLIPRKKVLRATRKNKAVVDERRALLQQQNLERKASAERDSELLKSVVAVILRQAGEDGRLYGSVTARDIIKSLASHKLEIKLTDDMIVMAIRIKEIGIHSVSLLLHADVTCVIKINVARTEQEAQAALLASIPKPEAIAEEKEGQAQDLEHNKLKTKKPKRTQTKE